MPHPDRAPLRTRPADPSPDTFHTRPSTRRRHFAEAARPHTLTPHTWRHTVPERLFTGAPVDEVAGPADRARRNEKPARMPRDRAAERTAAGHPVGDDPRRALAEPPRRTEP